MVTHWHKARTLNNNHTHRLGGLHAPTKVPRQDDRASYLAEGNGHSSSLSITLQCDRTLGCFRFSSPGHLSKPQPQILSCPITLTPPPHVVFWLLSSCLSQHDKNKVHFVSLDKGHSDTLDTHKMLSNATGGQHFWTKTMGDVLGSEPFIFTFHLRAALSKIIVNKPIDGLSPVFIWSSPAQAPSFQDSISAEEIVIQLTFQ